MLITKASNFILLDINIEAAVFDMPDIFLPNVLGRSFVELWVVETDMNARSKGFVELANPVCCQNNDHIKIFEHSQEDYTMIRLRYDKRFPCVKLHLKPDCSFGCHFSLFWPRKHPPHLAAIRISTCVPKHKMTQGSLLLP